MRILKGDVEKFKNPKTMEDVKSEFSDITKRFADDIHGLCEKYELDEIEVYKIIQKSIMETIWEIENRS